MLLKHGTSGRQEGGPKPYDSKPSSAVCYIDLYLIYFCN